jgi:hypothetical protein
LTARHTPGAGFGTQYFAFLYFNGTSYVAEMWRVIQGTFTLLRSTTVTTFAGQIRFQVTGSTLTLSLDANPVKAGGAIVSQLFRQRRADARPLDRSHRRMSGPHQERTAAMIPLPCAQAADDGELVAQLGELREVLADAQALGARFNGREFTAVLVIGFQIERVGLAWPAAHPQQDAMASSLGIV